MPIVDANDPITWNLKSPVGDSYWLAYIDGKPVSYCRVAFYKSRERTAQQMIAALDLRPGQRALLVGAGFGWTAEWLERLVPGLTVVATDTSTWIQANKSGEALHEILDLDVLKAADRAKLGKFDWVVSENILPWLTVAEAKALDAAMRMLGPSAHYTTPLIPNAPPERGPKWSWHTKEGWKEFLPQSKIIDAHTGEAV